MARTKLQRGCSLKKLLIALMLLCGFSAHASYVIPQIECADSSYSLPVAVGCPGYASNDTVTAIESTTFTASISIATAGDVIYYCAKSSQESTTGIDIENGVNCLFTSTATAIQGVNSFPQTGVTPSSNVCNYWTVRRAGYTGIYSNVVQSNCFIMGSGGGGGEVVTGWFAASSGNNSNNCTSHLTPCLTGSGLKAKGLASGDDVWFLSGDSFQEDFIIDWGCTIGNRCIVGTYHVIDSDPIRGLPSGGLPGSPDTAQSTWECATFYDDFPNTYDASRKFKGQLNLNTRYITAENLCLWKSEGIGVQVQGSAGAGDAIMDNLLVHIAASSGYTANRDLGNNEFMNSVVSQSSGCWGYQKTGCTTGGAWSSCAKHVGSNDNNFHHNIVRECWGEGMGNSGEGDNNRVADSTFYKVRSTNSYANGNSNTLFERNLYLGCGTGIESTCALSTFPGDGSESFWRTVASANSGSAFRLSYENSSYDIGIAADNNIFRNNLIVATASCMSIGAESSAEADLNATIGVFYLGNTCLAVSGGFWSAADGSSKHVSVYKNASAVVIQNNIFALRTGTGDNCSDSAAGTTNAIVYIESDYNQTDKVWDDNGCRGSNDQENTLVSFANSTWTPATSPTTYEFADACLTGASDAIGNGPTVLANLVADAVERLRVNPFDMGLMRAPCV